MSVTNLSVTEKNILERFYMFTVPSLNRALALAPQYDDYIEMIIEDDAEMSAHLISMWKKYFEEVQVVTNRLMAGRFEELATSYTIDFSSFVSESNQRDVTIFFDYVLTLMTAIKVKHCNEIAAFRDKGQPVELEVFRQKVVEAAHHYIETFLEKEKQQALLS